MTSPSPEYAARGAVHPPAEYVEDFAERYGFEPELAANIAAIVWAEAQLLVVQNARSVWHEDGTGPWCSACAAHPGLCKHIPDFEECGNTIDWEQDPSGETDGPVTQRCTQAKGHGGFHDDAAGSSWGPA